jgi:hypothetical protein
MYSHTRSYRAYIGCRSLIHRRGRRVNGRRKSLNVGRRDRDKRVRVRCVRRTRRSQISSNLLLACCDVIVVEGAVEVSQRGNSYTSHVSEHHRTTKQVGKKLKKKNTYAGSKEPHGPTRRRARS